MRDFAAVERTIAIAKRAAILTSFTRRKVRKFSQKDAIFIVQLLYRRLGPNDNKRRQSRSGRWRRVRQFHRGIKNAARLSLQLVGVLDFRLLSLCLLAMRGEWPKRLAR